MKALIPGSFDPITNGHLDIIKRAASMFETVTVGVFVNPSKDYLFPADVRAEMIIDATKNIPNVNVVVDSGYVADYCKLYNIGAIVKGVRNKEDFEYELKMAKYNKERNPDAETVFLPACDGMADVSSTAVRQRLLADLDISNLVPKPVSNKIKEHNCYLSNNKGYKLSNEH